MIPKYDPTYSYRDIWVSFLRSSKHNSGKVLCDRLKDLYSLPHVFTFNSARMALFALLKAYGRTGGVLMPAYTCIVVPEAVKAAGYEPQFVDIDCHCLNVTRKTLAAALTPATTVILATHLFGIPCDLGEIRDFGREHGLLIIEDAAPAIGAEYDGKPLGSLGDAAILSFQATKVISSENGGALLTGNHELSQKVAALLEAAHKPPPIWYLFMKAIARKTTLHRHIYPILQWAYRRLGKEVMYEVVSPKNEDPATYLVRCSPFSSALVALQLDRLAENLHRRKSLAEIYLHELSHQPEIRLPQLVEAGSAAWIQFPVLVKHKLDFFRHMQQRGIDLSWTYRYSCAESYGLDGFPEANKAAHTVLGLPTYPSLSDDEARYICRMAKDYSSVN